MRGGVECELPIAQKGRGSAALAAQDRAHACQQFTNLKWLDDVIVGPQVKAVNTIIDSVPRGHDNDGGTVAVGAQFEIGHSSTELNNRPTE